MPFFFLNHIIISLVDGNFIFSTGALILKAILFEAGLQIFFEIKYTESEFGKITNNTNDIDKYERKWNEIYSKHLEKSYYLKDWLLLKLGYNKVRK